MRIEFAHVNVQGVDVAVFNATSRVDTDAARAELLDDLTRRAQAAGRRIQKSVLAYRVASQVRFYGTADLVRYLETAGLPRWTHSIDV